MGIRLTFAHEVRLGPLRTSAGYAVGAVVFFIPISTDIRDFGVLRKTVL